LAFLRRQQPQQQQQNRSIIESNNHNEYMIEVGGDLSGIIMKIKNDAFSE